MLPDAITFFQGFFAQIWRLFTSFYIPGTNLTPAALAVGIFMISLFIRIVKKLFDISGEDKDASEKKGKTNESKSA